MNQSKIFLLIIILLGIGVGAFLIKYSKQPPPEIPPIKLPVKEKTPVSEEKKFVYEGKTNGIPTKIVLEFPYEFGHCHEHVWPK